MSTPVRPKSFKSRIERPIRSSIIKQPSECRQKLINSPVRHNPIARPSLKEVLNAPKAKRVRQSRLFSADSSIFDEEILPVFGDRLTHQSVNRLPVPRLYFENDDFMEMYSDAPGSPELSCDNRDSMTFLTQRFTDSFHTLLTDLPRPDSVEMDVPELTPLRSSTSSMSSTNTTKSNITKKAAYFCKVTAEQRH